MSFQYDPQKNASYMAQKNYSMSSSNYNNNNTKNNSNTGYNSTTIFNIEPINKKENKSLSDINSNQQPKKSTKSYKKELLHADLMEIYENETSNYIDETSRIKLLTKDREFLMYNSSEIEEQIKSLDDMVTNVINSNSKNPILNDNNNLNKDLNSSNKDIKKSTLNNINNNNNNNNTSKLNVTNMSIISKKSNIKNPNNKKKILNDVTNQTILSQSCESGGSSVTNNNNKSKLIKNKSIFASNIANKNNEKVSNSLIGENNRLKLEIKMLQEQVDFMNDTINKDRKSDTRLEYEIWKSRTYSLIDQYNQDIQKIKDINLKMKEDIRKNIDKIKQNFNKSVNDIYNEYLPKMQDNEKKLGIVIKVNQDYWEQQSKFKEIFTYNFKE